jgi:glycosyltransferase involved in cell wall biosynthesis
MKRARRIVVLGMLAKMPVPGVVWQTLHYLLGLERLGFEPYYVEAHARTPSMLMEQESDDAAGRAAELIASVLNRFGLGSRWAFQALHDDGRCYGMSERELAKLYRGAELLINLHGGTEPREELAARGRLVYLETDPVRLQIELHDGVQSSVDFLSAHSAFFTFAENLGRPECGLPVCERFDFRPTRQPVVCDLWAGGGAGERFTTIANWRQGWREVTFRGETYGWSKDAEWQGFLDLPARTGADFELALSGYRPSDVQRLERHGWRVRQALAFASDIDAYRDYISGSRAEFTVAKDQNIRFRTGWFSDRSATYLAAGRPVVTQDTGFGTVLPTGAGLFAAADVEEAAEAVRQIVAEPARHERAAAEIAREHFEAERVLAQLLTDAGVSLGRRPRAFRRSERAAVAAPRPAAAPAARSAPLALKQAAPLHRDATVLALIPQFECDQFLDDCLASLCAQTRPLDGIVVIDDASPEPPLEIVRRYAGVTLLRSDRNAGPYRLVQQVIDDTDYDAYLFQDADDWSAPDRLERLLEHAEREGADMIGSQEVRIFCDEPQAIPIQWPLDGNEPFKERPTAFPLLHPTTLVGRELVKAAGGYSTGLRFGGDAEFLRRAHYVGRCVNTSHHGYFRRIRQGSLTTAPATAIGTPARKKLMEETFARAASNAERVARGDAPDLSPLRTGERVELRRLAGPQLHTTRSGRPVARPPAPEPAPAREGAPAPVFVVGAERSGASALGCALGQHPAIALCLHGGWLAALARRLGALRDEVAAQDDAAFGIAPPDADELAAAFAAAASELATGPARVWVDSSWQLTGEIPALAALFPEARFIHVVRDVHSAVRALTDPPLGQQGATGGTQVPARLRAKVSEQEAIERWTRAVEAPLQAGEALGPERMLTVAHADLIRDPEGALRRCLEFLGEEWSAHCLRPLRELRTLVDDRPLQPDADPGLWARALALSEKALAGAAPTRGRSGPVANGTRVVMVTDHFPKFSETFFVRKALGLLERGWDVHVVCQRSNKEHWEYFPTLREQLGEHRIHVARDGLEDRVRKLQPALVHFGYGTLARERMHLRETLGCRVVVSFRGYDLNSIGLDDPACYEDVWRSADMIHVVSESLWERAQERGCPADRAHVVIHDAVDVGWFEPPRQRDAAVGNADRPLRLLSVGRLHWKKGHEYAIAAARALVDRGIAVDYRIVGEGDQREATEHAIADLGLSGHVSLLGARNAEEVRELMAWADVFVHPSVTEAFGVAAVEAQAMGLPVVCSDAGGLPENVIDGATGLVVARRDAAALARAIARLTREPRLRLRFGRAARKRAETALSAASQLDAIDALYRELLERPAAERAEGGPAGARRRRLEELRREHESAQRRAEALRLKLWREEVREHVREFAARSLPPGAQVLVVSRGDEEIVDLGGVRGAHFPQDETGAYAGHHPADSADAISRLEEQRARGADFLIVPATSAWWLQHYDEFTAHLDSRYVRLAEKADAYVVFALAGRNGTATNGTRQTLQAA